MSPLSMTKWLYGYNKQGDSIFYVVYHIVLATRYIYKVLRGGVVDYLKTNLVIIERRYPEIHILESNTNENYLHILVSVPPRLPISQVVSIIKSNTAKAMKEKFGFLKAYGVVARSTFKKEFSNGGLIFDRLVEKGYLETISRVSAHLKADIDEVKNGLRQEYPHDLERILVVLRQSNDSGGIWSVGCLVSTGEINDEIIRKYVEYQGDEDRGQSRLQF
jgi:REP element-mobilizing transposase RayT